MSRIDKREKLRKINEARLYQFKAALDTLLEYLHLGKDLNSASIEEDMDSVLNMTLEWFQKYVCTKITELDKLSTWRKNKGHIF